MDESAEATGGSLDLCQRNVVIAIDQRISRGIGVATGVRGPLASLRHAGEYRTVAGARMMPARRPDSRMEPWLLRGARQRRTLPV